MSTNPDRLYELLPVIYRLRDDEQGYPLRDLLRVLTEQVNLVEADIAQLYENWFIETCQDWVVPYLGDLIGYRPPAEASQPGAFILRPTDRRREIANTLSYRRRKGTLALLEILAHDVAGWPGRAVEFYQLLGWTQAVNHLRLERGQVADLRRGEALDRLDGAFDDLAHTVDVRRINSRRATGRSNIPSVGLFIWRLGAYPVTQTPAYCREEIAPNCYTFSVLGNDAPLFMRPTPETDFSAIAGELNVPAPIRRRAMEKVKLDIYGDPAAPDQGKSQGASLMIWRGTREGQREAIPANRILVADLSGWKYQPPRGYVAVDPELGRIAFPPRHLPKYGVWVSYHYGFSADIGGGEYPRPLAQPPDHTEHSYALYRVGQNEVMKRINEALALWRQEKPLHAVIEITDSNVYVEPISIVLAENQTLQLRAANRTRPVIRLLDWQTDQPDALAVTFGSQRTAATFSHLTLDGLLITGRGVQVRGLSNEEEELPALSKSGAVTPGGAGVTIRHCTLVPGWSLGSGCEPKRATEPSLEIINIRPCITIEHSILGAIQVALDVVREDPLPISIHDSILDATNPERDALCGPGSQIAHVALTITRSTVFGGLCLHALPLAENSIFNGPITVARRQIGCMRFCYVTPGSRTPRRYHCQPDLVEQAVISPTAAGTARAQALARERLRVRPLFNSERYGTPTYCQLAPGCAEEIQRGADDEAEMGGFHHLYQPQRTANLLARLNEYTPAGMDAGIIFAS